MRDTTIVKLLKICSVCLVLLLCLCACAGAENTDEVNEKRYEVDGVIFENDLMSIAGVTTDEYLEVYKTLDITFKYFAKDFAELRCASVINLGGTVLCVTPGGKYLDELDTSTLEVVNDGETTVITDQLEEFYICQDENGNIALYYETYNLYDQKKREMRLRFT